MKCPTCNVELSMTQREGIEIDYCPRCRGVWLDRGELDKIVERSATRSSYEAEDDDYRQRQHGRRSDDDDRRREGYPGGYRKHDYDDDDDDRHPRGRRSFWSNLFDFD